MRIALIVGLVGLAGCAGARAAGGPERGRNEPPSAAPGTAGSASLFPRRRPTGAEYAAIAKEMELRCAMLEGDPRSWQESSPNDCDDLDMQATYSYCTWGIRKDEQGIRAVSQWARRPELVELPFQPRSVPKHELVRCAEDTTDDSRLPEQRVRAFVELESGFLVGYDSGEFGGGLYWYARDGELKQPVLDDNVVRIFPFQSRMLVFTGIAHMTMDDGRATLLELASGSWSIVHSLDLAGAPSAFLDEPDGSILVASGHRLVRVSNASKVEILHRSDHGFWGPKSIVKDTDGTLYLDGLYVVVRLRPLAVGYAETWLAPSGVTRPRPPDETDG